MVVVRGGRGGGGGVARGGVGARWCAVVVVVQAYVHQILEVRD